MLNDNFVILGNLIYLVGGISYLIDTIRGKIKPNKITWLLWGIAPFIAFFAEINQGVGIQSLLTFTAGFIPLVIFFASFINKKAYWKITFFDIICGTLSILGLILWYLTMNSNFAIIFSILADGLAALPTIRKSFNHPKTENRYEYLASVINASLTLLTIRQWTLGQYGFPIYILISNLLIVSLIVFKFKKRFHKNKI